MDSLEPLREEISEIDKAIFEQVSRRLEVAKKIGAVKLKQDLPIVDKKVEEDVLEKNRQRCVELGMDPILGEMITKILIVYSIKLQEAGGD